MVSVSTVHQTWELTFHWVFRGDAQRRVSYKSLDSKDNQVVFHEVEEGKPKDTFRERYNILQMTGRECDLCLFALI